MKRINLLFGAIIFSTLVAQAKERVELIPFGDMESWVTRYVQESKFFGGKMRTIYAIAPTDTIRGAVPFEYGKNGNPWWVSHAYARVLGMDKVSGTTRPERRGNGWCARMDCKLEDIEVAKIDLKLQIAGTIFIGYTYEPVPLKGASDPYSIVEMGRPFSKHPKAIQLDYKAKVDDSNVITHATGMSGCKKLKGRDCAEVYAYLQYRWEENGKIYAHRIATAYERIWNDIPDWVNAHRIPFRYGDITVQPDYKDYEGLNVHNFKAKNSKGTMVKVNEVGYGNEKPTHLVLMISSGCYPAFTGHDGNTLWVDNVSLVYDE